MAAVAPSRIAIPPALERLLAGYPKLQLSLGDEGVYRGLRTREPTLQSCLDDPANPNSAELTLLALRLEGEPAAVTSLVTQRNKQKRHPNNLYGRIDLVIVAEQFRGLALGRLIVAGTILLLLDRHGSHLYSISCLAAHPAIARILEGLGFRGQAREGKEFIHEEIRLDAEKRTALWTRASAAVADSAQVANFRLRQNRSERGRGE